MVVSNANELVVGHGLGWMLWLVVSPPSWLALGYVLCYVW